MFDCMNLVDIVVLVIMELIMYVGVYSVSCVLSKKWRLGFYVNLGWIGYRTVNICWLIYDYVETTSLDTEEFALTLLLYMSFLVVNIIGTMTGYRKKNWKLAK